MGDVILNGEGGLPFLMVEQADGTFARCLALADSAVSALASANVLESVHAEISLGTSLAACVDLGAGRVLCAIDMPAGWDKASLTFQASPDLDGAYDNLYDQYGMEKTVVAAAGRYISLDDPAFWLGVRYLKVRSGTAAAPVNQSATRVINLITKPV